MLLGMLPRPVASQTEGLLQALDCRRIFVAGSGPFRLERTVLQFAPEAEIIGNDLSLYSCAIGAWLSGAEPDYRFTGPLEFLERALAGASAQRRAAGVLVALDVAPFVKGAANAYKTAHLQHLQGRLTDLLDVAEAKLAKAFGGQRLAGFRPGSWTDHVDQAIEERATIATLRVSFAERQDQLIKWLDKNAEWAKPAGAPYDPKDLQEVMDKILASGVDYLVITDQHLARPEPRARRQSASRKDHFCYAGGGGAQLTRERTGGKPFDYLPLDLSKVTKASKVEITRVDGPRAMYIRSIYLKKTIAPAPAEHNFLIFLDGMLVGVLAYAPAKFAPRPSSIYLMSDVSVSREAKVSKLIARLAANRAVLRDIAARKLQPVDYVVTTAFSDHPVSMKYRGVFELLSRKDAEPPQTGHILQYGAEALSESPQDAFGWWWSNYGDQDRPRASPDGRGRRR